jgi:hypothetical protein
MNSTEEPENLKQFILGLLGLTDLRPAMNIIAEPIKRGPSRKVQS